jgi:hypothetical protein
MVIYCCWEKKADAEVYTCACLSRVPGQEPAVMLALGVAFEQERRDINSGCGCFGRDSEDRIYVSSLYFLESCQGYCDVEGGREAGGFICRDYMIQPTNVDFDSDQTAAIIAWDTKGFGQEGSHALPYLAFREKNKTSG